MAYQSRINERGNSPKTNRKTSGKYKALRKDGEKEENKMAKIKTGTTYGYRVDVIKVEKDGTTHAPEAIDFPEAKTLKDLARACVDLANAAGLAQVLPIMPTAVKTARRWAVEFTDIVKCSSFRYISEPEEVPETDDDDMTE